MKLDPRILACVTMEIVARNLPGRKRGTLRQYALNYMRQQNLDQSDDGIMIMMLGFHAAGFPCNMLAESPEEFQRRYRAYAKALNLNPDDPPIDVTAESAA
jgi:hypothetical protein